MTVSIPSRLQNGPGNKPDAALWNDNYDWLTAMMAGNFLANPGLEQWSNGTSFTNPSSLAALADFWTWEKSGGTPASINVARESTNKDTQVYSLKVDITGAGSSDSLGSLVQTQPDFAKFAGVRLAFAARVKVSTASKVRLRITDGVSPQLSDYHTGGGTFELLQAVITASASLTELTVKVETTSDFTGAVYIDSCYIYVIPPLMSDDARLALPYSDLFVGKLASNGGAVSFNSLNGSYVAGFKNRYCNGAFKFDQRNEGSAYTINASSIRVLDMVIAEGVAADGVFTVQRQTSTVPTGHTYAMKVAITTADASVGSSQEYDVRLPIEGLDVVDFLLGTASARSFTISFWARASVTGTYGLGIQNAAFNRSYVAQYTIVTADTWEYKKITIAGDTTGTWLSDTGVGIRMNFDLGHGTASESTANAWAAGNFNRASGNVKLISTVSATWHIAALQVEIGTQATEFERTPHQMDFARIQRYIEKSYALGTAIATNTSTGLQYQAAVQVAAASVHTNETCFKVHKRSAPTVTLYAQDGSSGNWNWGSTAGVVTERAGSVFGQSTHGFAVEQAVALEYDARGHYLATSEH